MKIQRTKNASRNILFGSILNIYNIAVPFVIRTAMIYLLGMQYLGLNSLFTSILQVLNLAELGVGTAMVYSMYHPITQDDTTTICTLMKLYRLYYRIIGLVICVLGLILLPFIPRLISGDVPDGINVYILYLINLSATVLSYWLFAYKNSLLHAHQRTDITSKITLCTNSFQYILQFAVLFFLRNYYYYVIVMLLTQALTNVITALIVDRIFPEYRPGGKLNYDLVKQINKRIRDLFTAKLGGVLINSTGSVVISAFLGLTVLGVYNSYFYILTSIIGFVNIIFNSCTAGIGNSIVTETEEKNYVDFKKFTFIISWLAGFCTCCFASLYQPFMKLWVGEDYMMAYGTVIYLCIYYFIYEINQLLAVYKDAAGIWHEDRFRPLVTALTNLILTLIMVQFWGIYGVLLATILSRLFVGTPWLLYNLFTVLFKSNPMLYIRRMIVYIFITLIATLLTYTCCTFVIYGGILGLAIKAIICSIVPNVFFLLVYCRMPEFKQSVVLVNRMMGGRLYRILPIIKNI